MNALTDTTAWWERTDTWTTRTGETIALEDLDPSHRERIIARIYRRVPHLRSAMGWRHAMHPPTDMDGDTAHDWWESEMYRIDDAPAEELVESLPLVKRLRELEPKVIVRVNSHRARGKMLRLGVRHAELFSWDFDGEFHEIPEADAPRVLAITGITRARRQDRSAYNKTWRMR